MTRSRASLRLSAGNGEDPAALDGFRTEVREWLAANVPPDWRREMIDADDGTYIAFQRRWMRTLRAGGYLAPHVPREWGAQASIWRAR